MLQHLHIRNLALLDEVSLEPDSGLITITGETGAGKSVILGALSLLSGVRADKTLIRHGQETCSVEAGIFLADSRATDQFLEKLGLPTCDENQLLISRTLSRKRISKIHINGALTTLQNLKNLGEFWIDFHGPSEPRKLFKERYQLEMLDAYAGLLGELETYQAEFSKWKTLLAEIQKLSTQEALSPEQEAFYQSQVEEIDALELTEESAAKLEADHSRLSKVKDLAKLTQQILSILASGSNSSLQTISESLRYAKELSVLDPETDHLMERVESMVIEVQDLSEEFQQYGRELDVNPMTISVIEDRFSKWQSVKRKFGGTLETVLQYREELLGRLNSRQDLEAKIEELDKQAAEEEKHLRTLAGSITRKRIKSAQELSKIVTQKLRKLGFKKASLDIRVTTNTELKEYGESACQFLFSANPGSEKLPLNLIASSGETARVMLALKTILARMDSMPVLVFDEVDANIGGEIGKIVGSELANISQNHQIFCVTHLPQVAAQGNMHLLVEKHQTDETTDVEIRPLKKSGKERVDELARMLGDRNSQTAITHARELLNL